MLYINGYFIKYASLDGNWVKETDKQYAWIELGSYMCQNLSLLVDKIAHD